MRKCSPYSTWHLKSRGLDVKSSKQEEIRLPDIHTTSYMLAPFSKF